MSLEERNQELITCTEKIILDLGYADKLCIFPIKNTATKRNRHFRLNGFNYFSVHMWTINKLSPFDAERELRYRVKEAALYFKL